MSLSGIHLRAIARLILEKSSITMPTIGRVLILIVAFHIICRFTIRVLEAAIYRIITIGR